MLTMLYIYPLEQTVVLVKLERLFKEPRPTDIASCIKPYTNSSKSCYSNRA